MSGTIAAVAAILTAMFVVSLTISLRAGRDPLSPWCLVPALHLVRTSPFLFLASTDPTNYVHYAIVETLPDLDSAFLWYGLIEAIGFVSCMAGIQSGLGPSVSQRLPIVQYRVTLGMLDFAAGVALGAGFLAYLMLLRQVGGLSELLGSLDVRVQLLEGLGLYLGLMAAAALGCVTLAYTLRLRYSAARVAVVVVMSSLSAAMFSTTGGRKLSLALLVSLVTVWHYAIRRIRHPVRLALLMSCVIAPYFIAMPLIRGQRDAVSHYLEHPGELAGDVLDNSSVFIQQLSYCETFLFVTNYFSLDTVWMGRTYLDLPKAIVPRRLMPNKPALDEGMYINTIAQGGHVYPGMPSTQQAGSAWPTETLGTGYWNFHVPGVVGGMFLLGAALRCAFEYLLRSHKSLFSLLIYQYVMFGFALSNLRMVQFVVGTATVLALFFVFLGARMRR